MRKNYLGAPNIKGFMGSTSPPKSLIDYIFRWMGNTFLPGYKEASQGILPSAEATEDATAPGSASSPASGGQSTKSRPAVAVKPLSAEKPGPKKQSGKSKDAGPTATLAPSPQPPTPNGHSNGHSNGHANGHMDISAAFPRAQATSYTRYGIPSRFRV